VPVWSKHRPFRQTSVDRPWLLRQFDQIRFHPVGAEELLDLRADMVAGRGEVRIEPATFDLGAHRRFLAAEADGIAAARERQQAAFAAERGRWQASGELDRAAAAEPADDPAGPAGAGAAAGAGGDGLDGAGVPPPGAAVVTAPFAARVGQVDVSDGDAVAAGDRVAVLEALKMEVAVVSEHGGTVSWLGCRPGQVVAAGQPLVGVSDDA
jgi:urea carboxylase